MKIRYLVSCVCLAVLLACNLMTLQPAAEETPAPPGTASTETAAPGIEQPTLPAAEIPSPAVSQPADVVQPTAAPTSPYPQQMPPAPTALNVPLRVQNPPNLPRDGVPITSGVPLPRGMDIRDAASLRLVDADGNAIAAQFTPLARWGSAPSDPAAPLRWVLLDFQVSLSPGEERFFFLQQGGGAETSPLPPSPLTLNETASDLEISTGAVLFRISKTDGSLSMPALKAPAVWRWVDGSGIPHAPNSPVQIIITLAGNMRSSVAVKGSFTGSNGETLSYTTRYWFYAGSPLVRIFYTVENNQLCPLEEYAQPTCHDIGSAGSLEIQDLSLLLPTALGEELTFHAGVEGDPLSAGLSAPFRLYQDSSGTPHWDRYPKMTDWDGNPLDARPRMQSYVQFNGYRASLGDETISNGSHTDGWMTLEGSLGAFSAGVSQFWQNFPKALRASPDGVIEISLFPAEFGGDSYRFNLRAGEHKTHELWLAPTLIPAINAEPPFASAPPEWYINSGAFGMTALPDWDAWAEHEQYLRYQLDPSPEDANLEHLPDTVFDTVQRADFYGIFDYGDLPIDYEGYGVSPLNIKYDADLGMWLQWARSGDRRWFDLALALDRHAADIDILHNLHSPRHWADGIAFGHSYHDEESFLNPHRNYGGTSPDTAFGTPGLLLAYYLTGYEKAFDSALELAESITYRLRNDAHLCSYFPDECTGEGYALMDGMYNAGSRPAANSLYILVEAYRATADPRYLKTANALIDWARPEVQPYGNGPTGDHGEEDHMRPWMLNMYLRALANYLDLLNEFALPDEVNGRGNYLAYAEWLRTYAVIELEPLDGMPRAAYPYQWWFDERQGDPDDEYAVGNNIPSINNWCYLAADAMAYAYRLNGDRTYLDLAAAFFRTGAHDPFFPGDNSLYTETKQMINAVVFGNIFLYVWERR